MLAGRVGDLQLRDTLSTGGGSVMQAVQRKSENGNAMLSADRPSKDAIRSSRRSCLGSGEGPSSWIDYLH